jgi:5-methylcytosine-specific restriction enzyme subunit McrC
LKPNGRGKKPDRSNNWIKGKKKNIEVFYDRHGKAKIRTGPYAGIIQLACSQKRIHFSTKVKANLFYVLSFLKSEDEFLYDPDTPIEMKEGVNFFDIIGKFFLNELNDILKKGLLKKYVRKSESQRFLKGKMLVKNQIRESIVDKSKFFCEYNDLTFDNLENRVVLNALASLISLIRFNVEIKNELKKLETILKDFITFVKINPQECNHFKFNRINQYYEGIIKLSKLILEERFIRSIYKGESRGFNFIVNMNKVYEDFITEIVEAIINTDPEFKEFKVEKQPRFDRLVEERSIITKPDIVIRKGEKEYPLIIDTKYKREDSNVDYYQVIAYSLALRDCEKCCLIYPMSEDSEISKVPLTLIRDLTGEDQRKVKIYARAIDLSLDEDRDLGYESYLKGIKEQVRNILLEFTTTTG